MDFTAQNVEYAVSVFYNGEPIDQAKAHTWLTSAQRVPDAWNFVWELLQPTKVNLGNSFATTRLNPLPANASSSPESSVLIPYNIGMS